MSRKYGALSVIATIFQGIGALIIILAVLFYGFVAVGGLIDVIFFRVPSMGTIFTAISTGVLPFLAILIMGIGIVAVGQLIRLFQDMEANSRKAAEDAHITAEETRRIADMMWRLSVNRLQDEDDPQSQQAYSGKEKRS